MLDRTYRFSLYPAALALALTIAPPSLRAESYYDAWVHEYNPGATTAQFAHAVAMDSRGNVVVTGRGITSQDEFYTAKYDALDGHLIWEMSETAPNTDFVANAVAIDSVGDVVVTGSRHYTGVGGSYDYYTVKYSGATGERLWLNAPSYNGEADGEDVALKVVIDHADNIVVTGKSAGQANPGNSTSYLDFYTIKYAKATGATLAADRYTTSGTHDDIPAALAVDSSNNVIVAGTLLPGGAARFYVRKLSSSLSLLWDSGMIDTGGDGGATGVAIDSSDNMIATGTRGDGSGHRGFYTRKWDSMGTTLWTDLGAFSQGTYGEATAGDVAVGPDKNPIVTGYFRASSGTFYARTVKYSEAGSTGNAVKLWDSTDNGLGLGDTNAKQLVVDGASNAVIVGATDSATNSSDLYVAKYDALSGEKIFSSSFDGSFHSSDDGNGVAVDRLGNIAIVGTPFRLENGSGLKEFATIKFNRFIAANNDGLPDGVTGVADSALYFTGDAPALSDSGGVATKFTFAVGTHKTSAILTQGASGGTSIPAVVGASAPGLTAGTSAGNFISVSDPVIAPDGTYAFAGKVSGLASKAGGIWTNMTGNLQLALRQGDSIPGLVPAGNLVSVMNLSMENGALIALLKVTGLGKENLVLARIDSNHAVSVLLRSGQPGLMIGAVDYTVKSFTVLSPAPASPGDGRWQNSGGVVVKAIAFNTSDVHDLREVIVSITNGGSKYAFISSNTMATGVEPTATYKSFGFPSIGQGYAFRGTFKPLTGTITGSNDTALIYSFLGIAFTPFAREGQVTGVTGLPVSATYSTFTDPILNQNGNVAFIGTIKGTGLSATNNRALIFGPASSTLNKVVQLNETAAAPTAYEGETPEPATRYAAFGTFALGAGAKTGPVFLAKLAGAVTGKTNMGLFAVASDGVTVRRLLRTGDHLGDQIVKTMTLLKAVPTAFSAARSFNSNGEVVVALTFTNNKTALLPVGIP